MSSGELSIIIHATEDLDKVLRSIRNMFMLDLERLRIQRNDLSGHFGNPLTYIKIKLDREATKKVVETLFKKMSPVDKETLIRNLDEYIHKRKLYIRLDKQLFCSGELSLGETDAIRIVIKNITKKKLLRQVGE